MQMFLTFMHIMAAIFLIVVVLLQQGKGADIGSAFGAGASQTVFGSRGAGNFLTKMTTAFVVLFMATSVSLTYFISASSILSGYDDEDPLRPVPAGSAEPIPGGTPGAPSDFEAVPAQPGGEKKDSSGSAAPTDAAPAPTTDPATAPAGTPPTDGAVTPPAEPPAGAAPATDSPPQSSAAPADAGSAPAGGASAEPAPSSTPEPGMPSTPKPRKARP
jgi:preprotein translocase subunit SecG